ncbi:TIGR02206 family membrane protein [Clostridium ganghwense]|uniref:TIGR02206 family membrane protein n=1 Tax=Clostridium ganghwense TaxID=312089 RepID=A0ABT4CJU1_9CLOT|nr:TIGR02206 family membrane protein [Clostridium ganghwense]MCY6369183.1 TIGR02206 family membrane protein [Clostridium ganghwense]
MKLNIDIFWKSSTNTTQFHLFCFSHLLSLTIIALIILFIYFNREKLQNERSKKNFGYTLGTILFFQQFLLYFWYVDSGNFTLKESLPLYTCRLCIILCIFMLLNGSYKIFEVVYFWGLGGASIALLNPDTSGFVFPHIMFVQFFVGHGGILISLVFMIFVYKYTPNLNSLKRTFKWTFVYLFAVGGFNYLVNGNYSYLRQKPLTASPLDYLPPYPYYVLILVGFMFVLFFLLYLPFYFYTKKNTSIYNELNSLYFRQ